MKHHISSFTPRAKLNASLFESSLKLQHLYWSWVDYCRRNPWTILALKAGLVVTILMTVTLTIFLTCLTLGAFGKLPTQTNLSKLTTNIATEVYAADQTLLGRYYFENRSPIRYSDISPHFINALLATEDVRYFNHNGVDLRSWLRVLFKTILMNNSSSGGGSTITQQLAKNLYPRQHFGKGSLIINKLKEVIIARRLEKIYTKEEILEIYLNTVPFSENTYGIKVASNHFFNTTPDRLNPSQSAVLVAMLKATTTYNPITKPEKSKQRRNLVLNQMAKYGFLNPVIADSLIKAPLKLNYFPLNNNEGHATYFREHLRLELKEKLKAFRKPSGLAYNLYTDGLRVYTTIDAKMQEYAEQAVRNHLSTLQQDFEEHLDLEGVEAWETDTILTISKRQSGRYRNLKAKGLSEAEIDTVMATPVTMTIYDWEKRETTVKISPMDSIKYYLSLLNAGFLAIEPGSGKVKAWVGGIDHKYFKYDHVKSRRQVGSTFKPIVYTKAIQSGIHPCAHIGNYLRAYPRYENWMPKNADNKYGGMYSMEGGLINSVNTVTVNLAMRSRPKAVAQLAMDLGISGEIPGVPAIALGAVEASLEDMVTVYGTFANRGLRPEISYISRIETKDGKVLADYENEIDTSEWKRVLSVDEADMITSMLRAAVDRGTGRRLRFRYEFTNPLAGKTGTSQNHSDGWFMGFNSDLVAGVWVGAESPAVRFRNLRLGQGANTALPVFALFFDQLNKDENFEAVANAGFEEPSIEVRSALNCANIVVPEQGEGEGTEGDKPANADVATVNNVNATSESADLGNE